MAPVYMEVDCDYGVVNRQFIKNEQFQTYSIYNTTIITIGNSA